MTGPEANAESRLDDARLAAITAFASLDAAAYSDIEDVVRSSGAREFLPNPDAVQEPRSGIWISYSEARRSRPAAAGGAADGAHEPAVTEDSRPLTSCIVCGGRLPPAIDKAALGTGTTFITPNLYPMVYPFPPARSSGGRGLHLLQWCSTEHDADLHNMPVKDVAAVLGRLAALERFLLHSGAAGFPRTAGGHSGYAALMKNRGFKVGGSVEHGHQQAAHLALLPRFIAADRDFARENGRSFAESLLREAGVDLMIGEYPGGVRAVVPPFMRRPLEAVIVPPLKAGEYLHDLDAPVIDGLAAALRETTGALELLMGMRRMTFDYNLAFHTGPVELLYIEVLPYTQPLGGFEQLGHYLCQEEPATSARAYREVLGFRDPCTCRGGGEHGCGGSVAGPGAAPCGGGC